MQGFEVLHGHLPTQGTYLVLAFYAIVSLIILFEYVRCRRYHGWLQKHADDRETVPGKIASVWTMPSRTRLLVKYTTLKGLTLYNDVVRDVPYYAIAGYKRGETVEVTYRRSNPDLVYLEPFGKDKLKGVARGLIVLPAVFVIVSTLAGFGVFQFNF